MITYCTLFNLWILNFNFIYYSIIWYIFLYLVNLKRIFSNNSLKFFIISMIIHLKFNKLLKSIIVIIVLT